MAARHLEVLTRRRRWLWPCGMESKEGIPLFWLCDIYNCAIYIYIYVCFVSSPYQLVFGDDCVRDTREQMML